MHLRHFVAIGAATLTLTSCASSSSPPAAAPATSSAPAATTSPRASTTRLVLPTPVLAVDPCKLTAAEISAVVGFSVTKKATNYPDHCEYEHSPGGSVSFGVDAFSTLDVQPAKNNEMFSLGGRYVTITDESGFAHEAFTAVKNPGDKSPGVIADFWAWLAPGHLKIRIYYPQGGTPPGRSHALTLAHKMLS